MPELALNNLQPKGRKTRTRKGRGIGSGLGKTAGKGHKGQTARSGGSIRPGFEGGQMPLQMRLPKFGFTSRQAGKIAEIRLKDLSKIKADVIDLNALREAKLINGYQLDAKIILFGTLDKPVTIKGLRVTKGAKAAIESAGGKVESA